MKDSKRILLVEDEQNFGSILSQFLKLHHFDVEWVMNGAEGWSKIKSGRAYDCCVIDVMMPEMDGFTLGKEIRNDRPGLPFIFLTAKSMKEDMVKGYEAGAIDYITKPFDSEILVLKINALLQRQNESSTEQQIYQIASIVFDSSLRTLKCGLDEQRLSPKENAILSILAAKSNKVVSREEIVLQVWGDDNYFNRRSMDVYMTKLRKYLSADPSVELISLHAGGYQLTIKQ